MSRRVCEVCGGSDFRHLFHRDGLDFVRCRACRLIRTDPGPSDAALAEVYGPGYHDAWGVSTAADRVHQLKMATFRVHVLPLAALQPGMRILDCGAAFGALMAVASEAGLEPYGVELSTTASAEIASRFGQARVYSGAFEDATFPGIGPDAFDAVFMCDFIEHVRDPIGVLRKAVSLLRPGGRIVLTTPDAGSISCRVMRASWPHYKVEHLYYFDRRNLVALLGQAGLTVTKVAVARKVLNAAYLRHHFDAYPRPVVTRTLDLLSRVGAPWWDRRGTTFSFGEMVVTATKA